MKIPRSIAALIGIASFVPVVAFFTCVVAFIVLALRGSGEDNSPFKWLLMLVAFMVVWSIGLEIFYTLFMSKGRRIADAEKHFGSDFIHFLRLFGYPLLWYHYIWRPTSSGTTGPNTNA
jgi:hypothetical protein